MTERRPREHVAALYSRVAPIYDAQGPPFFAYAGRRLVELAQVGAGSSVLDIGAGRGAVLSPAAARVAGSGRAVGIDIAPGMMRLTRRSLLDCGWTHTSVVVMDAGSLGFLAKTFGQVLCSFAVFFFQDVPQVLGELTRVLQPGGVVGFAFSRGVDPRWAWYEELLRGHGAFNGLPPVAGTQSVTQPGVLCDLLSEAGYTQVEERVEPTELWYATPETWWVSLWAHGSRRPLERLASPVLARVRREALREARRLVEPRGLPETMTLVYVLGRRT